MKQKPLPFNASIRLLPFICLAAFCAAIIVEPLQAADGTWTAGSGDWNVSTNWQGGIIADGDGSLAHFANGTKTITLTDSRTVGRINWYTPLPKQLILSARAP